MIRQRRSRKSSRHVDYLVSRIGIDHVAFGSDFEVRSSPAELGGAAGLPRLLTALRDRHGYDEDALEKIACRNWLRVLDATWHQWGEYFRLASLEPRPTLIDAAGRFSSRGRAVDLGAGTGRDTAELLRRGWSVLAIDREQDAIDRIRRLVGADSARLETRVAGFEDAVWPSCDLVNASFALPFCAPASFPALWQRIVDSLPPGGRFSGQFFGQRDEWARTGLVIHSRADVDRLLAPFEVEPRDEFDGRGTTISGSPSTGTSFTWSHASDSQAARWYGHGVRSRHVGSSGLVVSVVGVGCNNFGWRIDATAARAVVDAAIEAGITFFDTAESYGDGDSEVLLGQSLAGRRDRAVIATKFGWGRGRADESIARGAPAYVRAAAEASLRRLGTDYIDLYQYHRPDGVTPIAETLGALDELVREGKVRHIGLSNHSAEQIRAADRVSAELGVTGFVSAQDRYSWLEREAEEQLIPVCEELGLGLIPYFPLARGLLSGKYHRDAPVPQGTRLTEGFDVADETWDRIEALESFAHERGLRLLDVAIGGLAAQPTVCSVIAGASNAEQVRANAAAGAWEPSAVELEQLLAL